MVNLIEAQEGIWRAISKINKYTVVDYIEFDSIDPPFIRLGNLYFDDNSVKNNDCIKAQQYVNIYSTYSGKKEILEMMDEVNKAMETLEIAGHQVRIKRGHQSLSLAKDQLGSIYLRMDKNNNNFYRAVLVFDIYIY